MNITTIDRSTAGSTEFADFLMLGVGSASPRVVAVLAQAIGLPIETVVDAVYRAPVRLLANVASSDAERLVKIVQELGLQATSVPTGTAPARAPTLDVAGELTDLGQADAVAEALATFLGTTPASALDALLTPPGILLGNITASTVDALVRALPAGAVGLTSAEQLSSRYALFAASLTPRQQSLLRPQLPDGVTFGADGSITLFDLSRESADAIWRRLKATEGICIVNQAFLRFTLFLTAMPADAAASLEVLAGVPAVDYPSLANILPVPVERHVAYADIPARLATYAAAGFGASAELSTFVLVQLDVLSAPASALELHGLQARPPFRTAPMPEPRARLLRARLEAAGADVMEAA